MPGDHGGALGPLETEAMQMICSTANRLYCFGID